ncbi:hypothetical protein BB561_003838 [Smittium simulii]|uniref:Serine/threonine-protein phosphatase n=1 Tax=Smittium simulii TaxID=133385 RepID=A0A2T9YJ85_9FUNG|nr:hypothetical protein BB561_003838 [Smittium simulii]
MQLFSAFKQGKLKSKAKTMSKDLSDMFEIRSTDKIFCEIPQASILTEKKPLSSLQVSVKENTIRDGVELTNYVSVPHSADAAIVKHPTKTHKSFSIDELIFRLLEVGFSGKYTRTVCLKNSEIVAVCQAASEVFLSQPNLLELSGPVKIAGDIHGQYYDLLRLFDKCGYPPQHNYLFLGDYVDRGRQSLETILLLLCYKIKYPNNFFLLRGNHETSSVSKVYGFYDECKRRASSKIWKSFIDTFNTFPVAALISQKIFCIHGGLSPELEDFNQINKIERPCEVEDSGLLNDLLWSDPSSKEVDWGESERGVSFCFSESVVEEFVKKMDIDMVCRAHMVVEDGYEFFAKRKLVTIFSAPNYCGEFDNSGGIMNVSEDLLCSFEILKPMLAFKLYNQPPF